MEICTDLRHSRRVFGVFGLSALTGYLLVVGHLLLFRAPVEIILGVSVFVAIRHLDEFAVGRPVPSTAVRSQVPASRRDHS